MPVAGSILVALFEFQIIMAVVLKQSCYVAQASLEPSVFLLQSGVLGLQLNLLKLRFE